MKQPPRLMKAARLDGGEVKPLVETFPASADDRAELLRLWERLSLSGQRTVLLAPRLTAREEGVLPPDAKTIG